MLTCIYSYDVPVDQLLLMENALVTGKDNPFKQRLYNMMKQIYIYFKRKILNKDTLTENEHITRCISLYLKKKISQVSLWSYPAVSFVYVIFYFL